MSLQNLTATQLADKISKKELSAKEALNDFRSRAEKLNGDINAIASFSDGADKRAEEIDKKIAAGEKVGRLAGVPILVKDMFCHAGEMTTAGSNILKNYRPPYTCTVVEKLEAEGAVVYGKTNQDEFAMGSSNENSIYGSVKNPWSFDHVPGGSSGGAAAAAATRMAPISFGTDTGGSIRQPASFCGSVGIKPTYGRVSRHGIIAFASSLDQAGPITNNVRDAALASEIVSGHCRFDSTSSTEAVPSWSSELSGDLKGMKVGLPSEYFGDGLEDESRKAIENLIEDIRSAGAEIVEVSLPRTKYAVPIYYVIATCEASSNLARYDGVRFGHRHDFTKEQAGSLEEFYSKTRGEGFGEEVKRRIMLGTFALSSGYYDAYYSKACKVRRLVKNDFDSVFEKCDVILAPVTTGTAFKIGERIADPITMYMNDIYTISANLAGLPGISLPCGLDGDGLPIGVQLMSKAFDETSLFKAAQAIEDLVNFKEVPGVIR